MNIIHVSYNNSIYCCFIRTILLYALSFSFINSNTKIKILKQFTFLLCISNICSHNLVELEVTRISYIIVTRRIVLLVYMCCCCIVFLDQHKFNQILSNLLLNELRVTAVTMSSSNKFYMSTICSLK